MLSLRENKTKSGIIAGAVTVAIITLLILSGPASAFVVNMGGFSDTTPKKGTSITSSFSVNMATNEGIAVTKLQLMKDGVSVCDFNADGSKSTACTGITIVKLASSDAMYGYYGYGYGYGYGSGSSASKLDYNITIDTTDYALGAYEFKLNVITSNYGTHESSEQAILVGSDNADSGDTTTITAEQTKTIDFVSTANTKIELNLSSAQSGDVSVFEYSSLPSGTSAFSIPALGRYIEIVAGTAIEGAMTGTTIKVYYTDAEVSAAGLDESSLRLSYYNSTSATWTTYNAPYGGVDTVNNYVWAITNHFSIWGIFGNALSSAEADTDSGGIRRNPQVIYGPPIVNNPTANPENNEPEVLTNQNRGFFRITGAVIGAIGTPAGLGILTFFILLVCVLVLLQVRKRIAIKKAEENN